MTEFEKQRYFANLDVDSLPTPCYVVDQAAIRRNLEVLQRVQEESGAKVLLALKAFSMYALADVISDYLCGVCASGLHEARLGKEYFSGEVHTFSAAYPPRDIEEVLYLSDHVIFNSFNQWRAFQKQVQAALLHKPSLRFGLRVNPRHSEGTTALYDPCSPGSRLGIPRPAFEGESLKGISGLHFHTLCEQDLPPLKRTLDAFITQFSEFFPQLQWVNFGGGHHITRSDYQVDELIDLIVDFRKRYGLEVILEPGEAIAINTGVYVSEVLDIVHNDMDIAIIDGSCTAHMPDVLEMPYRPNILYAEAADKLPYRYRIGGLSCLAGDVVGDYSFAKPLKIGERLLFMDMAHYTMVKTTTFNGVRLPSIVLWDSQNNELEVVKSFAYEDFKARLS